jgi:hypothetical protein
MQPKWLQKMEMAEEENTRDSGHDLDQEAKLMVRAVSLRGTVEELAVDGRGRKRRRRKYAGGRRRSSWWLVCHW